MIQDRAYAVTMNAMVNSLKLFEKYSKSRILEKLFGNFNVLSPNDGASKRVPTKMFQKSG